MLRRSWLLLPLVCLLALDTHAQSAGQQKPQPETQKPPQLRPPTRADILRGAYGPHRFMLLVGVLAALGPARRSLRIDPTEALRSE